MPPPSIPAPYTIRPGLYADRNAWGRLYMSSFTDPRSADNIVDALFPEWREQRAAMDRLITNMFTVRYWSLEYRMTSLVDAGSGEVVGFACWKRPKGDISWVERWLYPSSWLYALMQRIESLRYKLQRGYKMDPTNIGHFMRTMATIEPQLLNSPRRRAAQYLSTVAVDPALQGKGLGVALMQDGLARCEAMPDVEGGDGGGEKGSGRASWLIARLGTERFYEKFGFVEVGRSNVGAVSHWNGGAIMFKE